MRAGFEGGEIFVEGLDFDDAALGFELSEEGVGFLAVLFEFFGGKQSAVRDARAAVRRMDDSGDFRLESFSDGVEEIREGGVAGSFRDADSEGGVELVEVGGGGFMHALVLMEWVRGGEWIPCCWKSDSGESRTAFRGHKKRQSTLALHRRAIQYPRRMSSGSETFSDKEYARLADFRYAVRHFLEFSDKAAKTEGLTPQQHQALLVIRGSEGAVANVSRLAERLCLRHHTAVELAQRLEGAGLISRSQNEADRREIMLALTAEGEGKLAILTQAHRRELRQIGPRMRGLFQELSGEEAR